MAARNKSNMGKTWKKKKKKEASVTTLKYELKNYEIIAKLLKTMSPTVTDVDRYKAWNKYVCHKNIF